MLSPYDILDGSIPRVDERIIFRYRTSKSYYVERDLAVEKSHHVTVHGVRKAKAFRK